MPEDVADGARADTAVPGRENVLGVSCLPGRAGSPEDPPPPGPTGPGEHKHRSDQIFTPDNFPGFKIKHFHNKKFMIASLSYYETHKH